ncbi:E3 ubiquitin-protein ligase TRIM45-like [Saccostrea cucullata]|uniref:E3 ubiquitin-protein ligase TRIM45-like n=1 Tax=Saccostrea cuccullata TaxID=36930 RepID=UPI002ECFC9E6
MDPNTSSQDVIRCDLCETAIVYMYCNTCLNNLCKTCVGEHIATDELKDHRVLKFESRNSTPFYPTCKCAFHEIERCEMYCRHCDIPVCNTCLASDQHLGHRLSKILQVMGEKKEMIKMQRNQLNETIYPTYQHIATDVQNRILVSELEKKYKEISEAITKRGHYWHSKVDKVVKKLKSQLDEIKKSQLKTMQKHLNEINKKIMDIKDDIDLFDACIAEHTNDIARLISVTPKTDQYQKLPQKLVPSLPQFIPNTIQDETLSHQLGSISPFSFISEEYGYIFKPRQEMQKAGSSRLTKTKSPDVVFHQVYIDIFLQIILKIFPVLVMINCGYVMKAILLNFTL